MGESIQGIDVRTPFLIEREKRIVEKQEVKYKPEIPSPDLIKEYSQDGIAELYSRVSFWHGTGRRQYKDGKVIDVLRSLLTAKALMPEKDSFDYKNVEITCVSLSDRRMYASLYAKIHDTKKSELKYEYYPRRFWNKIFIGITGLMAGKELFPDTNILDKLKMGTKFSVNWRRWFKKIMKNPPLIPGLSRVKSDIEENYPILIGIN